MFHRRHTTRILTAAAAALALIGAGPAAAKIDLVTLPDRGETELTIYNSADLTLVRETRRMSFAEGPNPLQFSWANTLIDPTSVHLRLVEGEDFLDVVDITYPANTVNTLIWSIDAARGAEGTIEISYFTSGITWEADYVAKANRPETEMSLEGYVRVTNRSGEDYLNAITRLIVGEIHIVEQVRDLASAGRPRPARRDEARDMMAKMERGRVMADMPAAPMAMAESAVRAPKEVAKEGVSEYFLFTIEGQEDIEDGLSKRLPSFSAPVVPFALTYKHNPNRWGPQVVKFYKTRNDQENELGDAPLPNGFYQVFREALAGGLAYVGRHGDRYIPIGEQLEMNLGSDGLILLKDERRRFRREQLDYSSYGDVRGWIEVEEWEVAIRNSKPVDVPIEVTRQFGGDYDFNAPTSGEGAGAWTKKSETEYELKESIPPLSERRFSFAITTRKGSLAKK